MPDRQYFANVASSIVSIDDIDIVCLEINIGTEAEKKGLVVNVKKMMFT